MVLVIAAQASMHDTPPCWNLDNGTIQRVRAEIRPPGTKATGTSN